MNLQAVSVSKAQNYPRVMKKKGGGRHDRNLPKGLEIYKFAYAQSQTSYGQRTTVSGDQRKVRKPIVEN